MLDPGFSFLEIRTPNIDDVPVVWISQKLRPREWRNERHLGCGCNRLAGSRGRCANSPNQGKDFVVGNNLLGCCDRLLWLVTVIDRFELKLATIDAAGPVYFAERSEDSFAHPLAQRLCRTAECRYLSK